jgi:N-acetylgalactosamine-6-sulfatase
MTTRRLVALLLLLLLARFSWAADRPPNIVSILADDWGWGDLSCHGHKDFRTPNIDRLASQGIDFQYFNVCNPVCSPSRTAAMTGHFPARYSVHQHFAGHELNRQREMPDWLDPRAVTVSRLLQKAGYRTGHFGKWHLTHETIPDAPHPREYGFDESAVYNGPPPSTTPERLVDDAISFIKRNKDKPFFVNVWLHETHTPHYPSPTSLAENEKLDEQRRVYAAVVRDGDQNVGRILETLESLGLDDKTLVIFSSDNGPEWTGGEKTKHLRDGLGTYYSVGETGGRRGRKRSLFEGGIHVPFIVRWPGHAPAGVKDDATVIAAVDLLPTLCAAAGLPLPAGYIPDGENMLPALEGRPITRGKPLFWEWRGTSAADCWPRVTVREGPWKLALGDDDRAELYNLADDPGEQRDVAHSQRDRAERMTRMATEWRSTLPKAAPENCISKLAASELLQRPNILFVLADDQRWDTVRALAGADIHTPNLDRLVNEGFHFTNAYCMGSMTPAVCLPSRTMLLTGRSVWRLPQVTGLKAPPDVPLLPRVLRDAGYITYHCGKSGNSCRYGNAAFDVNVETEKTGAADMRQHVDQVEQFLATHDRSKPFLIYLAPPVPHDPRVAPREFVQLYDPAKIALSRNFMPQHPFDNGELKIRDEMLAAHPRTPEEMRQHLADYYACISDLDYQFGRITKSLHRLGCSENTVIIFSSDQGLAVGGRHGLMGKQNLYEHVKPPLVIAGPGISHGQSDALVYLYDLFPTICDLAHAPTPPIAEGQSLVPIMRGTKSETRPYLFTAYRQCQRMVRDRRWKLIEYFVGQERHTQLFDLSIDPDEMKNLAGEADAADELDRLREQLGRLGTQFEDPNLALYFAAPGNN